MTLEHQKVGEKWKEHEKRVDSGVLELLASLDLLSSGAGAASTPGDLGPESQHKTIRLALKASRNGKDDVQTRRLIVAVSVSGKWEVITDIAVVKCECS
jgi:hypothetical protein